MPAPIRQELAVRTLAMPADANPSGDIFGGWILSQMDLAAGIRAFERARGRVATIAIDAMTFKLPVRVGDVVTCYARVVRVGTTSITVDVETWALRRGHAEEEQVTQGRFTLVALDEQGRKRPVPPEAAQSP